MGFDIIIANPPYIENFEEQKKVNVIIKKVDDLVYRLYGLTDEEIQIIEEEVNDKQ